MATNKFGYKSRNLVRGILFIAAIVLGYDLGEIRGLLVVKIILAIMLLIVNYDDE